jgi:hypothetical protein
MDRGLERYHALILVHPLLLFDGGDTIAFPERTLSRQFHPAVDTMDSGLGKLTLAVGQAPLLMLKEWVLVRSH